jgi:hypothetical protein
MAPKESHPGENNGGETKKMKYEKRTKYMAAESRITGENISAGETGISSGGGENGES